MKLTPEFKEYLEKEGFSNIRETRHYGIIGTLRLMFTVGLVIDIDNTGYNRRYCYQNVHGLSVGYTVLLAQDQLESPPEDPGDTLWIKRKGEGGDFLNPNKKIEQ